MRAVAAVRWGVVAAAALATAAFSADTSKAGHAGAKAANAAKGATHQVAIEAVAYAPPVMTVHRGDAIVWVNRDPFPHTVTAVGAFDSRPIAAGASWRYVATKAGTFEYLCTLHPNMKGTLKVEP